MNHIPEPDASTLEPTAVEIRAVNALKAEYPEAYVHHTGGGCMAGRVDFGNPDADDCPHVLITDGADFGGPEGSFAVGLYTHYEDEGDITVCDSEASLIDFMGSAAKTLTR